MYVIVEKLHRSVEASRRWSLLEDVLKCKVQLAVQDTRLPRCQLQAHLQGKAA